MQVEYSDLDVLLEMQKLDLAAMQLKKARAELPQRIEVAKIKKKRDQIAPKLEQVIELQEAKEAEIAGVEEEDSALHDKQARIQAEIDEAKADFRAVETRTRDMAELAKRRLSLAEDLVRHTEELEKIKAVREQVENALAVCDQQETALRHSFREQDDDLVDRIRALVAQRTELASRLPHEVAELYEATAAKARGVAVGKLEGERCGVCRMQIDGGRLIELLSQAPLGVCPHCKRMLVIE